MKSNKPLPRKKLNESLEWAKFLLVKRITYSLIALVWLVILAMLYLLVTGKINIADAIKSLILGGALGGAGKLISIIYKSWLKPKD